DAPSDASQETSQDMSQATSSDTLSLSVAPHLAASDASSVVLVCVDPARVAEVWPHVAPLIARALVRGGFEARAASASAHDPSTHDPSIDDSSAHASAPDLAGRLRAGAALLWLAWDGATILAAAVTALDMIDGVKCCTLIACGGRDFARFGHLIAGLERYAAREGCARMRICGPKGWLR